jgi:HD superfamily phosphohydrolase
MLERQNVLGLTHGSKIENYTIVDAQTLHGQQANHNALATPLGEGGSSMVYLASQALFGKTEIRRAIKFFVFRDDIALLKQLQKTPVSKENFLNEIRVLSELSHKNLIKIQDADIFVGDTKSEFPYIVYDYMSGPTLESYSPASITSPEDLQREIDGLLEVCDGISYLHSKGFHHYDIAPKNIFCSETSPPTFIIGDLGLAIHQDRIPDTMTVVGSRSWMPPDALGLLDQNVDKEKFRSLQPFWDLYGLTKTFSALLEKLEIAARRSAPDLILLINPIKIEVERVTRSAVTRGPDCNVKNLIGRVQFAMPRSRQFFGVPELSPGMTDKQITLMPVYPLVTTKRFAQLVNHSSIQRLSRVPQLTAAYRHFPSANHTRLEHSLGVAEVMRRYLVSVINEEYALSYLSEAYIQTGLVAALVSNLHQFVFTNVINELPYSELWQRSFAKQSLLEKLLNRKEQNDETLLELALRLFSEIDARSLKNILNGHAALTDGERLIHSMLNSSIDARVVDYINRDSHHLGIGAHNFSQDEIFQFLTIHEGRIALNLRGVAAAEQIIAQRYWLFNRFYWNRPNRRYGAILRTALIEMFGDEDQLERLFEEFYWLDNEGALVKLEEMMKKNIDQRIVDLSRFLRAPHDQQYKIVYDRNIQEGGDLRPTFQKLDGLKLEDWINLEREIGKTLFPLVSDKFAVMIDLPKERAPRKLGEDIYVVSRERKSKIDRLSREQRTETQIKSLTNVSRIVEGILRSYDEQLRRLRVFVHPAIDISKENENLEKEIHRLFVRLVR